MIITIATLAVGLIIGMVAGIFILSLLQANKDPYDYEYPGIDETKKVVYISGKMSGMDEKESKQKFDEAEQYLRSKGYTVINPWKIQREEMSWGGYIIDDLRVIRRYADALYMLENWRQSYGARTEYYFAKGNGISILYQKQTKHE